MKIFQPFLKKMRKKSRKAPVKSKTLTNRDLFYIRNFNRKTKKCQLRLHRSCDTLHKYKIAVPCQIWF